jgi:hypothetical protein
MRVIADDPEPVMLMLDLLADVPHMERSGFRIAEPTFLLSQSRSQRSDDCWFAVRIARDLAERGEVIAGHPEMAEYDRFTK